jgi:uncharacterized protein
MKVLVTGASGMVGSALVKSLHRKGHEVLRLVRGECSGENEVSWDPITGQIESGKLSSIDAVVNLAGENIAAGCWSPKKKKRIWDSRVLGTQNLVRAMLSLKNPPKILINASAIGYYGDTGPQAIDERGSLGKGFLATVCKDWEEATQEAENHGVRVVKLRIGMVVSPTGGALKKMLISFKLGLGGKVGSGRQYMSWISIDDLVSMIVFSLENERVSGVINAVAPEAVTNKEFTKTLGKVLGRPTIFPLPAFVARFMLGEMADGLLLVSSRVLPSAILNHGFSFKHPTLEEVLNDYLG